MPRDLCEPCAVQYAFGYWRPTIADYGLVPIYVKEPCHVYFVCKIAREQPRKDGG